MERQSQLTQQATQPFRDPRRFGKNHSDLSDHDVTDIICLLHPNSPAAFEAVRANLLVAAEHILQNDDLQSITEEDILFSPDFSAPRDLALRLSSVVKSPKDGFRFGRNQQTCDILLVGDPKDKLVSNLHFKIFVNASGSLMLQDMSTNGTLVDDEYLKNKDRLGRPSLRPATRVLKHGSIINVIGGPQKQEIKFMVRIPPRGDHDDAFNQKLNDYLAVRGRGPQLASMRESAWGNHWNGGNLYNFTGLLGKGAFAMVYRIQTKSDGEIFAAKELDKHRFVRNGVLDIKFDSELKIMKGIKHPNIVDYIDCHEYSHWIYIIMEYLPYGELSQVLRERKRMSEHDVQLVTRQILHALRYLHNRNITHRDIKPDNILIASRDPLIVKLSDFGLSKSVAPSDQETFLKTFCGTLLYCAPEVYPDYAAYTQSSQPKRRRVGEPTPRPSPYNQSVDMWSFGAVIFHLLCGKPPITGKGDDRGAQMLNNIMTKEVSFTPLREAGVGEVAVDFVGRLLNRNPYLRPKETECLLHAWLKDVPDYCQYEPEPPSTPAIVHELDVVEEEDEDQMEEELIGDLEKLTQRPAGLDSSPLSPDRPTKRTRITTASTDVSPQVKYPMLPNQQPSFPPIALPQPGERLFGEITPSILRSSGIFGPPLQNVGNPSPRPDMTDGAGQVSVNDFGNVTVDSVYDDVEIPEKVLPVPDLLRASVRYSGTASSLMGAEAQIQQLKVSDNEVEQDISDAAVPETTNPVTPQTRELSPSTSVNRSVNGHQSAGSQHSETPKFVRQIDLGLLDDDAAFAADLEARQASRADKLWIKAQTFHGAEDKTKHVNSFDVAATIDARTGLEVGVAEVFDKRFVSSQPLVTGPSSQAALSGFLKPSRRLGRLVSLPGSFADLTINLEERFTLWGRGIDCNVAYADKKDTRVPKYALKITFWAPGAEKYVESGGDWMKVPGVRTVVATSATSCVWVNDVELRKQSADGEAALFGKIYTGDIITICAGTQPGTFLKFKVEITFGDSARPRPENEREFRVQREVQHHQRAMRERTSMRAGSPETAEITTATTGRVVEAS